MDQDINDTYREVFKHQIWGYFQSDMEGLLESSATPAISAALLTLSTIDWMASHCLGIDSYVKSPKASEVGEVLKKYFSQDEKLFDNEKFGEKFYQVFRHGLAHTLLPKGAGLNFVDETYYDNQSNMLLALDGEQPVLYVRQLYSLTIKALKRYEEDLGIDKELNDNFMKSHNFIINDGLESSKKMLELAPKNYLQQKIDFHHYSI